MLMAVDVSMEGSIMRVRSIVIANPGEDGCLTLIVSDESGNDAGQNGIDIRIPDPGKDIKIMVGSRSNPFGLTVVG